MLTRRTFSLQTEKGLQTKTLTSLLCIKATNSITEDRWTKVTTKNYKRPMAKDSFTKTDGNSQSHNDRGQRQLHAQRLINKGNWMHKDRWTKGTGCTKTDGQRELDAQRPMDKGNWMHKDR